MAVPRVPTGLVGRMPRGEFGRVWARAEHLAAERGPGDYVLAGVVLTFRWVAGRVDESPVTHVVCGAMPETVDKEYLAALAAARDVRLHPMRAGIARGAVAVLGWMGHGGPEPSLAGPA
ncbi:MAG: hypothetical protein ACRDQ9_05910 [Pseudonocardiaceae bacterium]